MAAEKWADYLISAVRFNDAETHIDKVRVHPDNGDKVGASFEMDRMTVIGHIDSGTTFATIYKDSNGKWTLGAKVGVITVNHKKYIRTHTDYIEADNLDDLPRY